MVEVHVREEQVDLGRPGIRQLDPERPDPGSGVENDHRAVGRAHLDTGGVAAVPHRLPPRRRERAAASPDPLPSWPSRNTTRAGRRRDGLTRARARTNNQLAVKLTPVEQERLWIFLAAELARKRRAAGLRLNHPEAVALITDEVIEAARAGRSYDEARQAGHSALSEDDVIDGVADLVDFVQIEALFEEGTQLVTLWFPVKNAAGPTA